MPPSPVAAPGVAASLLDAGAAAAGDGSGHAGEHVEQIVRMVDALSWGGLGAVEIARVVAARESAEGASE